MKRRSVVVALALIVHCSVTQAQYISPAMQFVNPVQPADSNSISLSYQTLSYFRDYEYFKDNIQTGYTYFGTWHYPRLAIQPYKWLKLEAGALVQKEFGEKVPDPAKVMFSLQFQQKNWRLIFGALEGNQAHQLIEPLMGYDRVIERPVEEGVQLKYKGKKIESDIWLDWQLRQTYNSDYPEELTGGLSMAFRLTEPGKPWQVKIPLQAILPHKGGQLDTNHTTVTTVMNSAAGLSAEWNDPGKNGFLKKVRLESFATGYRHFHKSNLYPFDKGHGFLANVFLQSKFNIAFLATYWKGTRYIAPLGAPLYESISSISGQSNYVLPRRNLLFLNLLYEKEVFPHFFVDARVSPYIDLKNGFMEHSFFALFSYRNNFRLGRLKK